MKLPSFKRILREDVKDAPDWVDGLINPLNSFMEFVYQGMNKNLTLFDNVAANVTEFTYRTGATYPLGQDDVNFQSGLKNKATGVMIMQIYDRATYTPPPGPCYVPWIQNVDQIVVKTITGLEASKVYTVRLVVF